MNKNTTNCKYQIYLGILDLEMIGYLLHQIKSQSHISNQNNKCEQEYSHEETDTSEQHYLVDSNRSI
jgi:hypothetical protein